MTRQTALVVFLLACAVAVGGCGGAGEPPAPAAARAANAAPGALVPLTVKGNRIMRDGKRFHFAGVNRDSLEWGRENWGGCGGDGHFTDADFARIAGWGATAVRFPLSQAGWLGRTCDAARYASAVDAAVASANAHGMYAILDLHWSDAAGTARCDATCLSGQQLMPDADSVGFWEQLARRYGDRTGVVFNLFNEPHDVSWACWRDGGCAVASVALRPAPGAPNGEHETGPTYRAAGMQDLYDAIRAQGAKNLVLVAGLQWAYDLSGVGKGYALTGDDIAYDTHVYTAFHHTTEDWDAHFGRLAARVPVVSTEFGAADCSTDATARLLRYFAAPAGRPAARMSWTIWSWNNPGNCSQPSVLADWDGTPLPGQGELIREAMRAAAAATSTSPSSAP